MACFHEGKKPERRVEDMKKRIKTLKKRRIESEISNIN